MNSQQIIRKIVVGEEKRLGSDDEFAFSEDFDR